MDCPKCIDRECVMHSARVVVRRWNKTTAVPEFANNALPFSSLLRHVTFLSASLFSASEIRWNRIRARARAPYKSTDVMNMEY